MRPCGGCDRVRKGEAYDVDRDCRPCWLFHHSAEWNKHYGGDGTIVKELHERQPAQKTTPARVKISHRKKPCVHLGMMTGETRDCDSCGGGKDIPLHYCALHEICTRDRMATDVRWCRTCPDYSPSGEDARAPGLSLLLTGGVGDAIAVESFLKPEERERIECVYYANPKWREVMELFRALPNYPRLKQHVALPSRKVHRSLESAEKEHGKLDGEVIDGSIGDVFPSGRHYRGSSFLTHRLAKTPALPVVGDYAVLCPASSWYNPPNRAFNAEDWRVCHDFLEQHDLYGVVLYRGSPAPKWPPHDRIVDMTNQTTSPEAVEILKGAKCYLGIDSCWSVLAAKLFACLSVKLYGGHGRNWAKRYFAPRSDFDFLHDGKLLPPEVPPC